MADLQQIEDYIRDHKAQHILGKGGTEQERRENAFRFTNTVALDLRRDLKVYAGLLKKTAGVNAFGFSADRLALRSPGDIVRIYDIIGSSEDPTAAVTFGDNGLIDVDDFADPDPNLGYIVTTVPPIEPPHPPVDPPVPPIEPPSDVDLLRLLNELHVAALNTEHIVKTTLPQIDAAFGAVDDRCERIEAIVLRIEAAIARVTTGGGGGVAPVYEGSFRILGQSIRFTLTPKQG